MADAGQWHPPGGKTGQMVSVHRPVSIELGLVSIEFDVIRTRKVLTGGRGSGRYSLTAGGRPTLHKWAGLPGWRPKPPKLIGH